MLEKQKAKNGLKFISRFFSLLCVFAFLQGFFTNPLFAADYYWENPETISSNDSRFPTVATNSNGLIVAMRVAMALLIQMTNTLPM